MPVVCSRVTNTNKEEELGQCVPRSLAENPSKNGSCRSLYLKSFFGEGTVWRSYPPIFLTLVDPPSFLVDGRVLDSRALKASRNLSAVSCNAPLESRIFECAFSAGIAFSL